MKPILEEAAEITRGSRQHAYGDAADNHGCAAALKAAYRARRGVEHLDAVDHVMEMILLKVARFAYRRDRDSVLDVVGYCLNVEEMMAEEWGADAGSTLVDAPTPRQRDPLCFDRDEFPVFEERTILPDGQPCEGDAIGRSDSPASPLAPLREAADACFEPTHICGRAGLLRGRSPHLAKACEGFGDDDVVWVPIDEALGPKWFADGETPQPPSGDDQRDQGEE